MGALGIVLLVTGTSDLWMSFRAGRRGRVHVWLTGAVGVLLSLALLYLAGGDLKNHWLLPVVTMAVLACWSSGADSKKSNGSQTGIVFLAGALLVGGVLYLMAGYWPSFSGGPLLQLLNRSPFALLNQLGVEEFLLFSGLAAVQIETGNILVRRILTATGVSSSVDDPRMSAGRIIGPIERALIFAFAVAGQLAAAALIASAKSILRFPEITKAARNGEGEGETESTDQGIPLDPFNASEYFLLGSLASWAIAILPVLLVGGMFGS